MKRKLLLLIFILISCANEHNNQSEVQTTSDSLAAFNSFLTTNNLKAISLTDSDLCNVGKVENLGIHLSEKQKRDLLQEIITFPKDDYSAIVAKIVQIKDSIVSVYFLIQYSDIEAIHIINYCRANKILSHLNIGQISAGDLIFQDENKEISYNMQRSLSINDNGSLIVSKKYEETTIFLDKDSQNINYMDSVVSHYDIINGKFVLSKKDSVEHGKKYFY
jgi:lipoprotein